MFECKYKYELEDSVTCAKYVYKSQRRKRDKVIAIMIPILIAVMVALLVLDIVFNRSVVWDVILLVALVVLEFSYLLIPIMLVASQKKAYKKQNLKDMDYILIKIDNNVCTESLYKGDEEVTKSMHGLNHLTSYLEDTTRLVLVFNNVEFVCLRKDAMTGDLEILKKHLNRVMSKSNKRK
ncbi:MAG: hypothetical protein MJ152_00395 [Clostridia bacterium]|nr:hypothetical protein [Clostridia bacterium]